MGRGRGRSTPTAVYAPAIIVSLDPSRADSDDVTAYHRAVNLAISRGTATRCRRRDHHPSARVDPRENAAESRRASPCETHRSPRIQACVTREVRRPKKKEESCLRLLRRATNAHAPGVSQLLATARAALDHASNVALRRLDDSHSRPTTASAYAINGINVDQGAYSVKTLAQCQATSNRNRKYRQQISIRFHQKPYINECVQRKE